jgi:Tol biopolymer transport system component
LTLALGAAVLVTAAPSAFQTQTPQQAPTPQVYLAAYDPTVTPPITAPVNISNSSGYDNQPSVLPDGSAVLFTSNRDGDQTDIYRYDITSQALMQLTKTPESEYSPLVTPDGKGFSVIRVEADGTQRLWRFDLDGTNPRLVLESVKPVGYHVWIDDTRLALFILGAGREPATLQFASTSTQTAATIESRIGRSLLLRPGTRTVSFISQPQDGPRVIKMLDPETRAVTTLTPALDDSQDTAWDPRTGRLLMARGSTIHAWTPGADGWQPIADLSSSGIGGITRMAVGADPGSGALRLALVAEPQGR